MMSHFIFCFFLISFVGVFSDQRKVSLNSFVLLFDNVTADSLETEISLHKNGAKNPDLIVKWNFTNGDITAKWRMTNYNKIFMDGNKRIYIANIDKEYEGNYYIQYPQKHDEVDIIISGIGHDTTTTRSLTIETEGSSMMTGVLVMIIVVFIFMVAKTVVPIYSKRACCHCKKENENEDQVMLLTDISWLPTEKFGKLQWENIMQLLNDNQQQGLRRHCEVLNGEYPQLWQRHFGKLKWEDIMQLLNGDQKQGLQKHCDAEAERTKDRGRSKKRKNPEVMKRTGEMPVNVYRFLFDNKQFDPNVLE